MVSGASNISDIENPFHLKHSHQTYISPLTRSSSSTSIVSGSVSASHHESVQSMPSLFDAALPVREERQESSQLAFTTQDLEKVGSGSSLTVGNPSVPPALRPSKKRFVRHGLMVAPSPGLLDSINDSNSKRPGTMPTSAGFDPSSPQSAGNSSVSTCSGALGLQPRARPTVTTILRQHHVLQKAEQKEKDKVDSLLVSNVAVLEVDNVSKEFEKKQAEEAKMAESKRLLQARLAYEKAIAAARKVTDQKQKLAEETRVKEKEWQSLLEKQRELENNRRKAMAESLQRAMCDSRRAFDDMVRAKQLKVHKVKQETEKLQAEAKLKKQEEETRRQDRIQQIQAAKLALKRTKETMGNPNQFYRSIAIPETQIKLRLQKEDEKRKLQETRQKIQAAKQVKSVKLIRAMKKIQSCESLSRKQQLEQQQQEDLLQPRPASCLVQGNQFAFPPGKTPLTYLKMDGNNNKVASSKEGTGELEEMMEQLKTLRLQNQRQRQMDKEQRAQAAASLAARSRSSVKVIGANLHKSIGDTALKNNGSNNSNANNFYRHRSHYGIHT